MTAILAEVVYRTPEGGFRVRGSRVSLDSVVIGHKRGQSAEEIVRDFPTLSLEQVTAALDFYARNHNEVDAYLAEQADRWKVLKAESDVRNADLIQKIRDRKARNGA